MKIRDYPLVVRLPTWQSCVLEVEDISDVFLLGRLVDIRRNRVVLKQAAYPLDAKWSLVFEADDLIDNIPVKV